MFLPRMLFGIPCILSRRMISVQLKEIATCYALRLSSTSNLIKKSIISIHRELFNAPQGKGQFPLLLFSRYGVLVLVICNYCSDKKAKDMICAQRKPLFSLVTSFIRVRSTIDEC